MQYESKKCQDQTGMKNDKLDDKTRWELIPLDCLEDIARVYTEGAKKYRSQFLEDYAANLAAQATEIILGHNIVRK